MQYTQLYNAHHGSSFPPSCTTQYLPLNSSSSSMEYLLICGSPLLYPYLTYAMPPQPPSCTFFNRNTSSSKAYSKRGSQRPANHCFIRSRNSYIIIEVVKHTQFRVESSRCPLYIPLPFCNSCNSPFTLIDLAQFSLFLPRQQPTVRHTNGKKRQCYYKFTQKWYVMLPST